MTRFFRLFSFSGMNKYSCLLFYFYFQIFKRHNHTIHSINYRVSTYNTIFLKYWKFLAFKKGDIFTIQTTYPINNPYIIINIKNTLFLKMEFNRLANTNIDKKNTRTLTITIQFLWALFFLAYSLL